MIKDNRLAKVEILIQQKKFDQAEKILSELLAEEPNSVQSLAGLAILELKRGRLDNADRAIDSAIERFPFWSYLFNIKSYIAIEQGKLKDAEKHIRQAIKLDANNAEYFALLANIQLQQKKFDEALEMANRALEIDAENLLALNTRGIVLNNLDRSDEAFETFEAALREEPNNASTHVHYAWRLLQKGDHKKAFQHFKEALTIDPTLENARVGMLQALKIRDSIYHFFLYWNSTATPISFWTQLLGIYISLHVMKSIAIDHKSFQPYFNLLIIVIAFVASSVWRIAPIGNLALRIDGYLLLNKKEKMYSDFTLAALILCIVGLLLYLVSLDSRMLTIAVLGLAMMMTSIPIAPPSGDKKESLTDTIIVAFIGLVIIRTMCSTDEGLMSIVFILGFVAIQYLVNYLLTKEDNN